MRNILFAMLVILGAIVLSSGAAPAAGPPLNPADAQSLLAVNKDDRILGKPDAPITIEKRLAGIVSVMSSSAFTSVLPTL